MLNQYDVMTVMRLVGSDNANDVWSAYVSMRNNHIAALIDGGFEEIPPDDALGRVTITVDGKIMALRKDIVDQEAKKMIEAAQNTAEKSGSDQGNVVTEQISAVTCPQMIGGKPCGGAMNKKGVCPACETGRLGYKIRYTCESCGCDIVTREELR